MFESIVILEGPLVKHVSVFVCVYVYFESITSSCHIERFKDSLTV